MKLHFWLVTSTVGLVIGMLLVSPTPPTQAANKWEWPIMPHQVTRAFNPPAKPWLPGHRGVDLVGHEGQVVHSAGSGFVIYASTLAGRGVVVVLHGSLRTTYEPLVASVSVGDYVLAGQDIGYLSAGLTHCSEFGQASCLHWGLRRGVSYLNPLALVARVRLLPVP